MNGLFTKLEGGQLNEADQLSLRDNLAAWVLTHDGEVLTAERANKFVQSQCGHLKTSEKRKLTGAQEKSQEQFNLETRARMKAQAALARMEKNAKKAI